MGSTYKVDVYISLIAFIVTGILWTTAHTLCRNRLPNWESFSRDLRNRMCVELAVIPVRFGLVFFTLPAVLTAFTPAENWRAVDTERALIACSMVTGAYLFDLSIHRGDFLSTVHHCMGPALLLWIRISFSQFTSSDALVCRPLMMFVFFGAAVGGTASSAAVFLLRVGKKYLKKDALYQYFALCLAALTASTVLSCYMNVLYFLHVWQDAFAHFGFALLLPAIWEGFECYLQWRWLFRFYVFEKNFWGVTEKRDAGTSSLDIKDAPVIKTSGSSLFPRCTVPILKGLAVVWSGLLVAIYVKLAFEAYSLCGSNGNIWCRLQDKLDMHAGTGIGHAASAAFWIL